MLAVIAESRSPLVPFPADYWQQSRRPFASLIFVLPLLAIYEIGILFYPVKNGADDMLRKFLELFGFGQYFLLPCLTICLLLAWHHTTHEPWRIGPSVFYGMLLECVVLAFGLLVMAQLLGRMFHCVIALPLGGVIALPLGGVIAPPLGGVIAPPLGEIATSCCSLQIATAAIGPVGSFFCHGGELLRGRFL